MILKDTKDKFGIVTKTLHSVMALLVITELFLVYWKKWILPENSPLGGFFIGGLHKPLGVIVLVLGILWVMWRFYNLRPNLPFYMPAWQKMAAHLNHFLLFACILIMPLAGLLMSTAAGYPPNFFGIYQFPMFMATNKELAALFYTIHLITGYILMGLVLIHIGAALKHHFIDRNIVLKRMLP